MKLRFPVMPDVEIVNDTTLCREYPVERARAKNKRFEKPEKGSDTRLELE